MRGHAPLRPVDASSFTSCRRTSRNLHHTDQRSLNMKQIRAGNSICIPDSGTSRARAVMASDLAVKLVNRSWHTPVGKEPFNADGQYASGIRFYLPWYEATVT
jgi:hypothetical protein